MSPRRHTRQETDALKRRYETTTGLCGDNPQRPACFQRRERHDTIAASQHDGLRLLLEFVLRDVVEVLDQDVLDNVGLHPLIDALLDGRGEDGEVVTGELPEIEALIRIDPAEGFVH